MKLNMLLNSPLGASAPFGLNKKSDALGVLGLIGDIFGGMMRSADVSATNEANMWQNIITNNTNRDINESQLAWARDQYRQEVAENRFLVDQAYERELENRQHNEEYNSPSAIAARLRTAGINPFLAMAGGSGSVGSSHSSINAQVGHNPHANQPNMIPMQSGVPVMPGIPEGFGTSLAAAIDNMAKNDIARDALNEQIEARAVNTELEYLKFMEEQSKNKTQKDFYESQVNELARRFALDRDKFEVEKDWQNFQKYYQQSQIELHQKEVEIQNYLASSKIQVDNATISELASSVVKMKQEVFEMKRRGDSEQEINNWLAKQEKTKFKNMQLDWKRRDPESYSKMGQQWNDFTNWLTSPIRGIISLGIKP